MADCTPATLVANSVCLVQGMSEHELLASIAYQLAVSAGGSTNPATLVAQSKCFISRSDRELLAIIALLSCELLP